jgi:hypothetical protein
MIEQIQEMRIISWKINLKNGASIDLGVKDGDKFDIGIKLWVESLTKKKKYYFHDLFEQGEIWISPDEFSVAYRSLVTQKQPQTDKFEKIEGNAPKSAQDQLSTPDTSIDG